MSVAKSWALPTQGYRTRPRYAMRPILMLPTWRSFCRKLASLLLAMMIATPAVAEMVCADDALTHVALSTADEATTGSALPDNSDGPASPEPSGHCAFNHGHCNAIATREEPILLVQHLPALNSTFRQDFRSGTPPDSALRPPIA